MLNEGRDEFEQRGQTDQPQQEQEPTEQQNTSPLSSDAETEPLTNDDPSLDGTLTQQEAMHVRASPAPAAEGSPTLHGAVVDDVHQADTGETVTPSGNFGSESDLTDESERATPQPTETQDHGAHEDAPPLASSAESWDLTQKPSATGLKCSALDGLAELAASAGDMEQNDTAYTRTNDAGALETHASQDEVVEQEENTYARPVTNDGADEMPSTRMSRLTTTTTTTTMRMTMAMMIQRRERLSHKCMIASMTWQWTCTHHHNARHSRCTAR